MRARPSTSHSTAAEALNEKNARPREEDRQTTRVGTPAEMHVRDIFRAGKTHIASRDVNAIASHLTPTAQSSTNLDTAVTSNSLNCATGHAKMKMDVDMSESNNGLISDPPPKVTNVLNAMDKLSYIQIKDAKSPHIFCAKSLEDAGNNTGVPELGKQLSLRENYKTIIKNINDYNKRQYGNKGPVDNARNITNESLINLLITCGYNLDDYTVLKRAADFIMCLATDDFAGRDTTGTQMGNFKGSWPGGGFV